MNSKDKIRVAVAGPRGRMGSETIHMVTNAPDLQLVAAIDHKHEEIAFPDIPVYTDIDACFSTEQIDVLIDFTNPQAGKMNLQKAINYGIRPVIGTSGFSNDEVIDYRKQMEQKKLGGIIAPNFAIGAVLVMKFSQMAAKYFPDAEIIELHHDQKKDAPSGTAIKTAELMAKTRGAKKQGAPDEKETIQGARGADFDGMRIHSVRLPGLIAHQEVLFGGKGELLTLRHDSMDRASFMHGVHYAVKTAMNLETLVYGLENILD
ncbi:4-hydroxy-tetrahydrodipicolinate reductase [Sporolactobacillus sp. CPB3-1]|uniref:4-hydroxy-tetrahydrodipicolinate reductase n=1 Tax=Sporolactobacillus mangiferae TaxID=2940498 RepID=A0ABT0MEB8_9BACL|nr:4-hydroxy-tetrahydrodipicolinate reductase [Sporolactobacillus mangiferae]MCL1632614.1 4-hydroxy-tetrahydrodipicolinate reductase [Sporolactobacillus mangiferae]